MAQHLSDEEQLESLKRWWQENGIQLLLTVVVVVGGWFGWQQWQDYRQQQASDASGIYSQIMELADQGPIETLSDENKTQLRELSESLRSDYASSQYAQYATMMLARSAVGDKAYDKAAELFKQVIEGSSDDELANIARVRLARVVVAQKDYTSALAILDVDAPDAMISLFAEVRGDIHYYLGDFTAARAAYQAAISGLGEGGESARRLLEFKLNNVLESVPPELATMEEES